MKAATTHISASFVLLFSSLTVINFLSSAQFVLGLSIESWLIFIFEVFQGFFLLIDTSYLGLHDPQTANQNILF